VTEWVKGKTLDNCAQERADRRGTGAASGQDPLLDPCGRCNQGGRQRYKSKHGVAAATTEAFTDMAVTLTDRPRATSYLGKRGKGVVWLGVKTTGCSGLAYKLCGRVHA
jgi:hypothetical protein